MEYAVLLEDYLNGELAGVDDRRAQEHVKVCAGCRGALEDARASVRLLRTAEPSMDPGPGFARDVMARIRMAESEGVAERAGFWQPLVSLGWRFAATATLALGALLTYAAGWSSHPQPNVAIVRPIETYDILSPDPAKAPASSDEVLMMVAETNHGE